MMMMMMMMMITQLQKLPSQLKHCSSATSKLIQNGSLLNEAKPTEDSLFYTLSMFSWLWIRRNNKKTM